MVIVVITCYDDRSDAVLVVADETSSAASINSQVARDHYMTVASFTRAGFGERHGLCFRDRLRAIGGELSCASSRLRQFDNRPGEK